MDTESSSNLSETSLDSNPVDEISSLLGGEDTETEQEEIIEDTTDEETQPEESTENDESSDEEEGTDEEETPSSDDEITWAKALGVDEDKLVFDEDGNLEGVNVKVNGESSKVSVNDLVNGYQNNKSFTQKSQQLSEARKTFEQQRVAVQQDYQKKLENAENLSNILSSRLTSEFDNINWETLRYENPAEYAALRQDYASRANELKQTQAAIESEKQSQQATVTAETQKQRNAHMAQQWDTMLANNPGWSDEEVRTKDMANFKGFMVDQYGFAKEDFNNVSDARLIEVIKDAKAYRDGVKTVKKKMTKPVPKFQKSPGKRKAKRASKLETLTNKAQKAKGANKRALQTDAISELIGGL